MTGQLAALIYCTIGVAAIDVIVTLVRHVEQRETDRAATARSRRVLHEMRQR